MGNYIDILSKFFKIIPGGIFGLVSTVVFLICDFIAIYLYPGYSILHDMVSTLGVGPGALIFNFGLIFSGIFGVILYLYVGISFYEEDLDKRIIKGAIIFSIISSILMALIGVLPADQNNLYIGILHYITALLTWVTGVIYCTIFGYLIIKCSKYSNFIALFAFIPAFMMAFLLILILISIIYPFTQYLVPITEWMMVFSIMLWILVISSYTLYKKI
ncbi:MAG: DUF998 domain-containing protein [Promethearchaeota archaeon]